MIINRELHERVVEMSKEVGVFVYQLEPAIESYFDVVNFIEYVTPYFNPKKSYISKGEYSHLIGYIAYHAFFTNMLTGKSFCDLYGDRILKSDFTSAVENSVLKFREEMSSYIKSKYPSQYDAYMKNVFLYTSDIEFSKNELRRYYGITGCLICGNPKMEGTDGSVKFYPDHTYSKHLVFENERKNVYPLHQVYSLLIRPHKVALVSNNY